jgi:hypothetical protein
MKKIFPLIFIFSFIFIHTIKSQVIIDSISLVSTERSNILFSFNNTKLMAGKNVSDRYIVYYNSDTIFLNVQNAGIWTKKTVYIGANLQSATLALNNDTIWVCWKEGIANATIKARYTVNKGNTWNSILAVSPIGKVSAPSIFAASNGKIHFVWSKESTTDTTIYHNVYSQGAFLPTPTALSNLGKQGLWPSIIAIGDTILCSWKENPLPSKVWFRSSFDGGKHWNQLPNQPTTTLIASTKDPNLSYSFDANSKTHYLYLAYDGSNQIYLQRSTDFGNSWSNPSVISNTNKLSQFAHLESNNNGFVGISYEQRPIGASLFDDSKKDVWFTYSTNWGSVGSFSLDTLAYSNNRFGSIFSSFNKIDNNNFYLAWLTNDTIKQEIKVYEKHVRITIPTALAITENTITKLKIYPNPFTNYATIESKQYLNKADLIIYNMQGQKVAQTKNISGYTITIQRNRLPVGTYFKTIVKGKKIIGINRFIII